MDTCGECGETIYPDDETVSVDLNRYHFECAENADIGADE